MTSETIIFIENLEVSAPIGIYLIEKEKKNNFTVDIFLKLKKNTKPNNDNISSTLDYFKVYNTILDAMQNPCDLIETKAQEIADNLHKEHSEITSIKLKIKKIKPLYMEKCEGAGVEYTANYD